MQHPPPHHYGGHYYGHPVVASGAAKCPTESTRVEDSLHTYHHFQQQQHVHSMTHQMHLPLPHPYDKRSQDHQHSHQRWEAQPVSAAAAVAAAPVPLFVGNLTKDAFISRVSALLDRKADENSKIVTLPTYSEPESVFFSVSKPEIPTRDYVKRLVTYTQCSPSAFVVMLIYLERISERKQRLLITPFNMHRLLVTSLTLACKMLDDRCFANVHYAKVGGIPTSREMNRLELQFLSYMDYRLHVSVEEYLAQLKRLEFVCVTSSSPVSVQGYLQVDGKDATSGSSETCLSSDKMSYVSTDGHSQSNVRSSSTSKSKSARANTAGKRSRKDVRAIGSQSTNFPDFKSA